MMCVPQGEPQIPYVKRVLVLKALLTADDVGIAEPDVFEEIEAEWGDFLRQVIANASNKLAASIITTRKLLSTFE